VFAVIRAIRNRMTDFPLTGDPRNIKVRTRMLKVYIKRKQKLRTKLALIVVRNVVGRYSRKRVNMDTNFGESGINRA